MSLYDDVGGEAGLRRVLRVLYDRLFDDMMIGFFFAGRDKEKLIEHQLWFTARFLGGPSLYEGRPLPEVHAPFPILPAHFDRRHEMLRQVLDEQHVPQAVRDEWLRVDQSLKTAIVKSGEEARRIGRTAQ